MDLKSFQATGVAIHLLLGMILIVHAAPRKSIVRLSMGNKSAGRSFASSSQSLYGLIERDPRYAYGQLHTNYYQPQASYYNPNLISYGYSLPLQMSAPINNQAIGSSLILEPTIQKSNRYQYLSPTTKALSSKLLPNSLKLTEVVEFEKPSYTLVREKHRLKGNIFAQNFKTTVFFNNTKKLFGPLPKFVYEPDFYVEEVLISKPIKAPLIEEGPLEDIRDKLFPVRKLVKSGLNNLISKVPDSISANVGSDDLNLANLGSKVAGSVIGTGNTVDSVLKSNSLSDAVDKVVTNLDSILPVGTLGTS